MADRDECLLKTRDVAARLSLSERTVRQMFASGELTSFKINGSRRMAPEDLSAYIHAMQQEGR